MSLPTWAAFLVLTALTVVLSILTFLDRKH
jgi:uncharacterized protein (DUF983 family)